MILALALWVIVIASWLGMGRVVSGAIGIRFHSFLEEAAFCLGIGIGITETFVYILGISGWLHPGALYFFIAIGLALFMAAYGGRIAVKLGHVSVPLGKIRLKVDRTLAALTAILVAHLVFNFKSVLVPPLEADTMSNYFAIPKLFALLGKVFTPTVGALVGDWLSPLNGVLIYAFGFLLQGETLSLLFQYLFGLLMLLTIYSFGQRFFTPRTGLTAAAIFYATPLVNYQANSGKIDLQWAFFEMLAIYAFFAWFWEKPGRWNWLLLSAIASGFALGVRPLSLISILILSSGVVIKFAFIERERATALAGYLALYWAGLFGLAAHWYLRSFFFAETTPLQGLLPRYAPSVSLGGYFRLLWDISTLPWITYVGPHLGESVGPAFLALLPVLLLTKGLDHKIGYILVFALLYSIPWYLKLQVTRLAFQLVPLLSIVIAYGIISSAYSGYLKRNIFAYVLIVILSFNFLLDVRDNRAGWRVALGLESREEYLSRELPQRPYMPNWPMTKYINSTLGTDSRIVLVPSQHFYYLNTNVAPLPMEAYGNDLQAFLQALNKVGATHLLVNTVFSPEGLAMMKMLVSDEFQRNHLREVFSSSGQYLYEIVL